MLKTIFITLALVFVLALTVADDEVQAPGLVHRGNYLPESLFVYPPKGFAITAESSQKITLASKNKSLSSDWGEQSSPQTANKPRFARFEPPPTAADRRVERHGIRSFNGTAKPRYSLCR